MMAAFITNTVVLILALTIVPGLGLSGAELSGCITVDISGIRGTGGELFVGLFDKTDGFPDRGSEYRGITLTVGEGHLLTCRFEDVPYGSYAIAVFHDANLNGILDKNLFGLPSEGVGLSGNARRPKFESAKFDFHGEYTSAIDLRY